MKKLLYLILKNWESYLEWCEGQSGFFKYLVSLPFYIYVVISTIVIYFLIFGIVTLSGIIFDGGKFDNFFYQAFGLMIICFLAVIAFYAFGFALIIITEFIKSLSEKNDK